jgi:uncharacterized protein (DUF1810 family)
VYSSDDPYNLQRFVLAQAPVYEQVVSELRSGQKTTHWIWFIFPQLKGLGRSDMAVRYAIGSRAEAEAYLHHPVLGPRLEECTGFVNAVQGRSLDQILGSPDVVKFQSCVTLFGHIAPETQVFSEALNKYFDGTRDERTIAGLQ